MGTNNSSKKSSLLKREGFYVVLFLCLCVVAVITVYISKTNALKGQEMASKPPVNVQKHIPDAQQVKKDPDNTVPTMNKNKEEDKKEEATEERSESKDTSAKKKRTIALEQPIKGTVTKPFSKNDLVYTKALDIWETHEAIDIACSLGDEVKVAAAGKVIDIYNDDKADKTLKSGYGLTVVVEHDGFRTVYSNLADNLKVKKGDSLKAGSTIGQVGDTSVRESVKVDGAHLHFALLEKKGSDFITVDPTTFIKK
ncbi:MAG: M23 family metallopeptidase [Clostridium sp.]|uniref:M23 family metallopeptidase n=1 Tax=Clostridium sp. TaxID=1506 RepID=UPI002FC68CBA